jgi:hypothetical protein
LAKYLARSLSVEREVDKKIALITDEIVRRFNPESIILSGSFGRDEGAVLVDSGRLVFLSDCEIIVVANKYIARSALKKLSSELAQETDIHVDLWWNSPIKFGSPLVTKPTIMNYDLKYGSRILYGKDYLRKIPDFKPEDIPLWEGLRLLFNRMVESMKQFSISYLRRPPTEEQKRKLLYSISKLILACQDALLLCLKKYDSSYRVRNEMFKELFSRRFKKLGALYDYPLLASKATSYKLNPESDPYSKHYKELWFDTINLCDTTFRHIIEKDTGITFNSYSEFQDKYLKHPNVRERYYQEISGLSLYQNFKNIVYVWIKTHKIMSLRTLKKMGTPWSHMIYSVIPSVYFSFPNESEIDESQLKHARKTLSFFKELMVWNPDVYEEWEYLKEETYGLWSVLCADL